MDQFRGGGSHADLTLLWTELLNLRKDKVPAVSSLAAQVVTNASFSIMELNEPDSRFLFKPLETCFVKLAQAEPLFQSVSDLDLDGLSQLELYDISQELTHLEYVLEHKEECLECWLEHLMYFGSGLLESLPEGLCKAPVEKSLTLSSRLVDTIDEPHQALAMILRHFLGCDAQAINRHGLFSPCRDQLLTTLLKNQGLELKDLEHKEPDNPLNHLDEPAASLVPVFLGSSPFAKLMMTIVPHEFS